MNDLLRQAQGFDPKRRKIEPEDRTTIVAVVAALLIGIAVSALIVVAARADDARCPPYTYDQVAAALDAIAERLVRSTRVAPEQALVDARELALYARCIRAAAREIKILRLPSSQPMETTDAR